MSRRVWIVIGLAVAIYTVVLVFDLTPLVRGPIEWRWERWPVPQWDKVWPLAIALALIGLWVWWIDRRVNQPRWIALGLIGLILATPVVQLLAMRSDRDNPFETLFDRASDAVANSYFTASLRFTDVNEALRNYPQLMPSLDIHAQVHPPGLPLIYWATAQAFEAAPATARAVRQWMQPLKCNRPNLMRLPEAQFASIAAGMWLPMLASAMTVWCVYQLGKNHFGKRAGLYAAALWVSVPSVVLFPGSWSEVYPCLACLIWLAVDAGLRRRQARWFFMAGLLLSVSTFLELGTAALGLFLSLYILARYIVDRRNPFRDLRFLLPALSLTLIGVFSIWGIYQLAYRVSLAQIVEAMYPIHVGYEFNRWIWLINHPYEFAEFVGLPVFGLLVLIGARSMRAVRSRGGEALSLSLLIGLIALTLVDPARDETARTWMLFMPFAVVVAARLMVEGNTPARRFIGVWGLMLAQTIVMLAVLHVMPVRAQGTPPRITVSALPATASAVQADFSGMAQLIGYEIRQAGDQFVVDWYWRGGNSLVDWPYSVFNQLIDDQGQIVAQADSRPQSEKVLMTCWRSGEVYPDRHSVPIATDVPEGEYTLLMGLYKPETGERVPIRDASGAIVDHLEFKSVAVTH